MANSPAGMPYCANCVSVHEAVWGSMYGVWEAVHFEGRKMEIMRERGVGIGE